MTFKDYTIDNKEKRRELDEFAKKTIPILKEFGYIKKNNSILWVTIIFLTFSISATLFYYAGSHDWFKSEISQIVSLYPQMNITSLTSNEFKFAPLTANEYELKNNFTIINNIFTTCS